MGRLDELQEGLYGAAEDTELTGRRKRRFPLTPLGRRVPSDWSEKDEEGESLPARPMFSFRTSLFSPIGAAGFFLARAGVFVFSQPGRGREGAPIVIGGRCFIE